MYTVLRTASCPTEPGRFARRLAVVLSSAALLLATLAPAASAAPQTYTVQPGDTLAKIAAQHGLDSWQRLFDANPDIADPNLIRVGQVLVIPAPGEHVPPRPSRQRSDNSASRSRPSAPAGDSVWDRLAQCESGGRWNLDTGNGYYGGLQFSLSWWRAVGGSGNPAHHSREEQIHRGQLLQARQGWGAWPACSRKLGLR